jgi:hypothetical protein
MFAAQKIVKDPLPANSPDLPDHVNARIKQINVRPRRQVWYVESRPSQQFVQIPSATRKDPVWLALNPVLDIGFADSGENCPVYAEINRLVPESKTEISNKIVGWLIRLRILFKGFSIGNPRFACASCDYGADDWAGNFQIQVVDDCLKADLGFLRGANLVH